MSDDDMNMRAVFEALSIEWQSAGVVEKLRDGLSTDSTTDIPLDTTTDSWLSDTVSKDCV